MNLIEQLIADVDRHHADLTRRLADLQAQQKETKQLLGMVERHRKRLERDHARGSQLPLTDPEPPPEPPSQPSEQPEPAEDDDDEVPFYGDDDEEEDDDPADHTTSSISVSERTGWDLATSRPGAYSGPHPKRRGRKPKEAATHVDD
jgi:hypothetical protein